MTTMQKTIIEIADWAKSENRDPVDAVQEYFDEKGSHFSRAKVASILGIAREAERKEQREGSRTQ